MDGITCIEHLRNNTDRGKLMCLEKEHFIMPHYSLRSPHGLAWDWTRTSPQWAMARPNPSSETNSHSASQENLRMRRKIWVVFVKAGAGHGPQCGVECIQSTSSHLISLRISLLLSFYPCFGQRRNYCYSDFRKKILCIHYLFRSCYMSRQFNHFSL